MDGTPVNCNDSNACTSDSCNNGGLGKNLLFHVSISPNISTIQNALTLTLFARPAIHAKLPPAMYQEAASTPLR